MEIHNPTDQQVDELKARLTLDKMNKETKGKFQWYQNGNLETKFADGTPYTDDKGDILFYYIKQADLPMYEFVIHDAFLKWQQASKAHYQQHGDTGSCVLSDGIEIYVLKTRCKLPSKMMVISSSSVSFCQGSTHYEATKHIAMDHLRKHGLDPYYNYGRAD